MLIARDRFKLSALSLAIMASSSMFANANEQEQTVEVKNTVSKQATKDSAKEADDDVEVIEVTGMAGSLIKSINDKRFAGNIVDTINAEDIGKNTDQNIADALGRVTGVSIVSNNGEGTAITVRGASAEQNNITLNGQQLTSTEFSQSVDLSSFSADILDRLEVVKTPSADHIEGSLGANVNLKTLRPLNRTDVIRRLNVQGRYNDLSEENNYKISGTFTEKFLDETLGIAVTAYSETNAYRKDEFRANRYEASQTFRIATDQNGDVVSGFRGVTPNEVGFYLSENESDRYGGSLGIQFTPTDTTELMLDVTYSRQDLTNKTSSLSVGTNKGNVNFVEGEKATDSRPPATFTDPQQDWYSVDTSTRTVTKYLNRFGRGNINGNFGGTENENFSSTLSLNHEISDSLRMEAMLGYSSSESVSKPNGNAILSNGKAINAAILYDVGSAVVPVGFDCTTGTCTIEHGDDKVDFGTILEDDTDENGAPILAWSDNTTTTGFHPHDLAAQNLEWISERDRTVEDSLTTFSLDFDYDVDAFGITTFEFGVYGTQREKSVDDQLYRFETVAPGKVFTDEDGNTIVDSGDTVRNVKGADIASSEPIPEDFMDSLGYGRLPTTFGWVAPDAIKAVQAVVSNDDTLRTVLPTETREAQIDTQSVYIKANIELFDGTVTGDFGMRYVNTEVEANGYSGVKYWSAFSDFERLMSLIDVKNLRDTSLPECPSANFADPANIQGYERKYQRIDGLGWDTSAGPDPSTWTRIPAVDGPCHDPAWAQVAASGVTNDAVGWQSMWRYTDISTSKHYGWGSPTDAAPDLTWNGELSQGDTSNYTRNNVTPLDVPFSATTNSHEYTNLLPSLNLNFALSEQFVGRLALSKTMTRPEIDLLRPGVVISEGQYWNANVDAQPANKVTKYNTKLDPLTSKNLDLSLEWYFNSSSMLSVALFAKDMSNFVDTQVDDFYIEDIRKLDQIDPNTLVLKMDESLPNFGLENCMPQRIESTGVWSKVDPNSTSKAISDDYRDLCGLYEVTNVVNSKSATIRGLELGYNQVYDFLPGIWKGLGVSANYTFQESEYEAEPSVEDPSILLPSLPVADTPKHTYNFTTFWEGNGHQIRLSYRGSTDSLVGVDYPGGSTSRGRNWNGGSIWNEGRNSFDLSATYKVNNSMNITFQAINLTGEDYRQYYTSRDLKVVRAQAEDGEVTWQSFNEGNPLEGEAPKHRTYRQYDTGSTYRLGVNVRF
ncbi:TonB-dependent receptor [Saccharobesus litoralis]|uniref:TonB-dependent receptor n=1 Tax=Saccharobesus litoralis TaxID=2172099 RepID=A0A2S0VMW7_9ALTE|nr:TonB-dependent receptor [Saccharobesus litoralis]AWB65440.1 TonB-dependent receptor [Saccharobesus litoralis]